MSILLKLINKNAIRTQKINGLALIKCSTSAQQPPQTAAINYLQYDKDPGTQFIDPEVQKRLRSLTQIRLEKVYKRRPTPTNRVEYKFMTTEQIEAEIRSSIEKASKLLQMPPIVKVQEPRPKILAKDPALLDFEDAKVIITDITYGIKDVNRTIVVRQTDGTLENAPEDVRKRMNQLYFPLPGRQIRSPRLFEEPHLKGCLDQHNYEYVLDRLCIQFEPFELEYHSLTSAVYLHLNESKQFDMLRSTRHFGPLSFFLAWHKLIDDLLIDMIERDFLKNGVELICLMYKLNGISYDEGVLKELDRLTENDNLTQNALRMAKGKLDQEIESTVGGSANDFRANEICIEFIETFSKSHGIKKSQIELCLQKYRQTNTEKKLLLEGLQKAHGIGQ